MKKKILLGCISLAILVLSYTPLFILNPEDSVKLTLEDGIIQNISAICYFLSMCIIFYLFINSKSTKSDYLFRANRNIFFLILAFFFLFCLGEEISWGQRILNIKTPESISRINYQNEITIHNLIYFIGRDFNDIEKTNWTIIFSGSVIYSLWFLFYCVFIPLLNKLSNKAHNYFKKREVPLVSLWVGFLFPINYLTAKFIQKIEFNDLPIYLKTQPLTEIKENNYAILFLLVSISFLFVYKRAKS